MLICGWCSEQVIPTKEIDWIIFIVLLLFGVLGGILYLIYWAGKPGEKCPLCEGNVYGRADLEPSYYNADHVVYKGVAYYRGSSELEEALEAETKERVALAQWSRRRTP